MKQSSFQFTNPVLLKLDFEVNADFDPDEDFNVELKNDFNISVRRFEQQEANVILSLSLATNEGITPFHINAVISSNFTWDKDIEDSKMIDNLLNTNAPALLLGYLRPLVTQITNASPFPVYNIPFMNFNAQD